MSGRTSRISRACRSFGLPTRCEAAGPCSHGSRLGPARPEHGGPPTGASSEQTPQNMLSCSRVGGPDPSCISTRGTELGKSRISKSSLRVGGYLGNARSRSGRHLDRRGTGASQQVETRVQLPLDESVARRVARTGLPRQRHRRASVGGGRRARDSPARAPRARVVRRSAAHRAAAAYVHVLPG